MSFQQRRLPWNNDSLLDSASDKPVVESAAKRPAKPEHFPWNIPSSAGVGHIG